MIGNTLIVSGTPGRELETHTSQRWPLATQMIMQDGRKFRYALAGGVALAAGALQQAAASVSNHLGRAPVAAVAGAKSVSVALGATSMTANEFKDGYLHINQGAAGGNSYLIASHPASAGSATIAFELANGVAIAIPATAASVDLIHNGFSSVIVCPTSRTQAPVGVAANVIPIANFGWLQTAGPCSVLTQGTVVLGNFVVPSTSAAGAVAPSAAAGAATENQVGIVMRVGATTAWSLINLGIDA